VQALGRRHLAYGVRDEHYDTVGGALLWTLEKGLGEAFTPDVKEAWTVVYGIVARVMKDAANEVAPLSLRTPMSRRPSTHVRATASRPNFRPPVARPAGPPGSRMPSSMHSSMYNASAAPSSKNGSNSNLPPVNPIIN
jgi:hypothetical protein